MSSAQHKANLARIRENQRRSRARRREYLQELEQRLRLTELQGVEASAEVQLAARRVAGENKQLRELLNKCGLGDEHIEHYLQTGMMPFPEQASAQNFPLGNPGTAVQSLQHLITPRRPLSLENPAAFHLPSPTSREGSTPSVPTSGSSPWESVQTTAYSYAQQPQGLGGLSAVGMSQQQLSHSYALNLTPDTLTPRTEMLTSHPANYTIDHTQPSDHHSQHHHHHHHLIPEGQENLIVDEPKETMHMYGGNFVPDSGSGCFG